MFPPGDTIGKGKEVPTLRNCSSGYMRPVMTLFASFRLFYTCEAAVAAMKKRQSSILDDLAEKRRA